MQLLCQPLRRPLLQPPPDGLVVTVGPANDPSAFGAQPPNVCIERYLPHALLLPRWALVVSHGGAGTMLAALAHGLPLLTVPQGADQYLNADTCARRGVGRTLLTERLTPECARREVRLLLDETGYRTAARDVSAENRCHARTGRRRSATPSRGYP